MAARTTTQFLASIYCSKIPEPVFVKVSGSQESILAGWESIPGLLKRFTNTGSAKLIFDQ
jgi:hypothetical protein